MTLDDAKSLTYGQVLHYTGRHDCARTVGPRGGVTTNITQVRVTGNVKTWKRSPERVQVPVKYGMYESSYITEHNLDDFHLATHCPLA